MLSDNGKTFKADQLKAFKMRRPWPRPLIGVDYLNDLSALLNNVWESVWEMAHLPMKNFTQTW